MQEAGVHLLIVLIITLAQCLHVPVRRRGMADTAKDKAP